MPNIPEGNRSPKGPADSHMVDPDRDAENHPRPSNPAEQGATANIKQNTTNKGYFQGRRMK